MSDGIWAAVSGAVAQQRSLDVTANNVANANTTGFRADRVSFREALMAAGGADQEEQPAPDSLRFVSVSRIDASMESGALRQTHGTFDLALEGDGMFSLQTEGGERYTRAGQFVADAEGVLRAQDGSAVLAWADAPGGDTREIVVPLTAGESGAPQITVGPDGTISAGGNNLGQLAIRSFEVDALTKEGDTRFIAEGQGEVSDAQVLQGYLEGSNMNAVAGMNELITVSRSFEAFQKVIDTFKQLDDRTARELGKRG